MKRIWTSYGHSEWGERAFLVLEGHGWDMGDYCNAGAEQFRAVIQQGLPFLEQHPKSPYQLDVQLAVAQAYETWWARDTLKIGLLVLRCKFPTIIATDDSVGGYARMGCSMYRRRAKRRIRLRRRDQVLWAVSILLATALTVSGMHAKNAAELRHGEAGLYRLMPGIILGLLTGLLLDSPTVVLMVTIVANATVYCFVFKGLFWLYGKASGR